MASSAKQQPKRNHQKKQKDKVLPNVQKTVSAESVSFEIWSLMFTLEIDQKEYDSFKRYVEINAGKEVTVDGFNKFNDYKKANPQEVSIANETVLFERWNLMLSLKISASEFSLFRRYVDVAREISTKEITAEGFAIFKKFDEHTKAEEKKKKEIERAVAEKERFRKVLEPAIKQLEQAPDSANHKATVDLIHKLQARLKTLKAA